MGTEEATAHDDDGDQYGDQGDEQHVEEDADRNTPLTSVVRDPHLQDLLLNNRTTDVRAADRRKSKLAQLEINSNTPLYDAPGRDPEESRLRVTLEFLQMKAKYGWTDASVDDLMQYMNKRLPEGNTGPSRLEEAKKVVWYFPITPRLQRYFVDPKEAKLMRWHTDRK